MLLMKNLQAGYGKEPVITNIHFQVKRGETVCLMGKNGCGKSTLLKTILNLLPQKQGQVVFEGQDVWSMPPGAFSELFSYIPQRPDIQFPYIVRDMVLMGRSGKLNYFSSPGKIDRQKADEALELLGLSALSDRPFQKLSGGEKRLVLAARGICQEAKYVIMDEPTSELDYANQLLIEEVVKLLKENNTGCIIATHSMELASYVADRVLLMKKGQQIGFGGPDQILVPENLERAYGIPMDVAVVHDRYGKERRMCFGVRQ